MLDHLACHRASPDGGLLGTGKHTHGHNGNTALGFYRGDGVVFENLRILVDTEHEAHARAINICVQNPYACTGQAQRHGEVRRHRRFSYAALARGHPNNMRNLAKERNLGLFGSIAYAPRIGGKGHLYFRRAQPLHNRNALVLEPVADGACRSREHQVKGNLGPFDFQILYKVQLHDVLVQIGILDCPEGA